MNKVKQEAMINKHIDHISAQKAEKTKLTYEFNIGAYPIKIKYSNN